MRNLEVGSAAPELLLAEGSERFARPRHPRVLAFVRGWTVDREKPDELRAIRAQLRGLGAELVVLTEAGAWSFEADDDPEQVAGFSDRFPSDVATAALLYGIRDGRDGVFVMDENGVVRFAYRPPKEIAGSLADTLDAAGREVIARGPAVTFNRREWIATCLASSAALALVGACKEQTSAPSSTAAKAEPADLDIVLNVNGEARKLKIDPRTSLLDALRERLGLTGTKKGCDMGQCGACTVHVEGTPVNACLTLAAMVDGKQITTIEGLASGDTLHPMQQAFVEHDALQCGYCTPGQIMHAVALVRDKRATTDDEVREQMSGNICRCGAYPNIVAAIQATRGRG
jgi:xanthine dehydrogenase YagT iron-sulfur-binding subunit